MTPILEWLRAANVALTIAALATLAVRLNYTIDAMTYGRRLAMTGVLGLFAATAVGSAIKYLNGVPVDISVPLVTLACLAVLAGATSSRDERGTSKGRHR